MPLIDKLIAATLQRIGVGLAEYFDKSFETKSFDGKPWPKRRTDNRGTLMNATGTLRRSIKYTVSGRSVRFVSNMPYAKIHNEGGKIRVTPKLKRFFWAKYRELVPKVKPAAKIGGRGKPRQSKSSLKTAKIAEFYKAMALKKVGSYITIPQRQFIGPGRQVSAIVEKQINICIIQPLTEAMKRQMKPK